MAFTNLFFGERSLTKIAAIFDTRVGAQSAAAKIRNEGRLDERQVAIIEPFDQSVDEKLEPDDDGIWRTLVRAHVTCGSIGFAAGIVLFCGLYAAGVNAVQTTPGISLVAMSVFGAMFGLMVGGLLTIRPDHAIVIDPVREAARAGRWAVVAHPTSHLQRDRVLHALGPTDRVLSTL